MNNPIMWIDPSGLSAMSASAMQSAAMSLANAARSALSTIAEVRSEMESGASLLVLVGGMSVSGSSPHAPQHASIQIFIAPGHALWDTGRFREIWDGIGHATIGGFTANRGFSGISGALGEIGQPMVGFINDGFDMNRYALNSLTHLPGVTAEQVERMFLGTIPFNSRGAIPYDPTGIVSHNSNSFISGLLTYAGVTPPSMSGSVVGGFPGWNNPIPTRYFRPIPPIEVAPGHFAA